MNKQFLVEWWEEWSEAAGEIPRELVDCGWRCKFCKADFGSYLTETTGEAHYFDNFENVPSFNYCPKCGKALRQPKPYYEVENIRPCTVVPTSDDKHEIVLELFD